MDLLEKNKWFTKKNGNLYLLLKFAFAAFLVFIIFGCIQQQGKSLSTSVLENRQNIDNQTSMNLTENAEFSTFLHKLQSDNFSAFAPKTITGTYTRDVYTEDQLVFINNSKLVYQVIFDESTHTGIPQCNEYSKRLMAACSEGDPEYSIGIHRIKIDFLGSEWIISNLTPPAEVAPNDEWVRMGGVVILAKESIYKILDSVGENMTSTDKQMIIRLDDILITEGNVPIISFLDANGNVLSKEKIKVGETKKKIIDGKEYKVYISGAGHYYTGISRGWAAMALIEQELELKDGKPLDNGLNKDWTVKLFWKTIDNVNTLRSILLYKQLNN